MLRQAGSHVRLIVARPINDPATASIPSPGAPIVPTMQLDEHLEEILAALEKQDQMLIMNEEQMGQGLLEKGVLEHAQVHEVIDTSPCFIFLDRPLFSGQFSVKNLSTKVIYFAKYSQEKENIYVSTFKCKKHTHIHRC